MGMLRILLQAKTPVMHAVIALTMYGCVAHGSPEVAFEPEAVLAAALQAIIAQRPVGLDASIDTVRLVKRITPVGGGPPIRQALYEAATALGVPLCTVSPGRRAATPPAWVDIDAPIQTEEGAALGFTMVIERERGRSADHGYVFLSNSGAAWTVTEIGWKVEEGLFPEGCWVDPLADAKFMGTRDIEDVLVAALPLLISQQPPWLSASIDTVWLNLNFQGMVAGGEPIPQALYESATALSVPFCASSPGLRGSRTTPQAWIGLDAPLQTEEGAALAFIFSVRGGAPTSGYVSLSKTANGWTVADIGWNLEDYAVAACWNDPMAEAKYLRTQRPRR